MVTDVYTYIDNVLAVAVVTGLLGKMCMGHPRYSLLADLTLLCVRLATPSIDIHNMSSYMVNLGHVSWIECSLGDSGKTNEKPFSEIQH